MINNIEGFEFLFAAIIAIININIICDNKQRKGEGSASENEETGKGG